MRTEPERGGFSAPSARVRRRRRALGALAVAGLAVAAWAVRDVPAALGRLPGGARADRVRRSPQFRAGAFRNPVDTRTMVPGTGREMLRDLVLGGQPRRPAGSIPVIVPGVAPPTSAPTGELGVIWYGHASALIEIEGRRVLLDPVWSDRCSPSARLGPRRLHPVPVPLDRLPRLDAIVISHDGGVSFVANRDQEVVFWEQSVSP